MFDVKLIRKLNEGHIFKNYGDLCDTLKVKREAGNSKVSQLKELGRYIKLKKEGHKLIVEEVYEEPKFDYRGSYVRDLRELYFMRKLIERIEDSDEQFIYVTQKNLLFEMGLLDERFKHMGVKEASELLGVKSGIYFDNWKLIAQSLLRFEVIGVLESLEDKLRIKYELVYVANYKEDEENKYRELSEEEVTELIRIEREALEKINSEKTDHESERRYSRVSEVSFSKDAKKFFYVIGEGVKDLGVNFIFKAIKISFVADKLEEDIIELEKNIADKYLLELTEEGRVDNEMFHRELYKAGKALEKRYIKNARDRHKDALKDSWATKNPKLRIIRKDKMYVPDAEKIVKNIIAKP